MPLNAEWPLHRENGSPLPFLCQIHLGSLPPTPLAPGQPRLPPNGILFFFGGENEYSGNTDGKVIYLPIIPSEPAIREPQKNIAKLPRSLGRQLSKSGKQRFVKWPLESFRTYTYSYEAFETEELEEAVDRAIQREYGALAKTAQYDLLNHRHLPPNPVPPDTEQYRYPYAKRLISEFADAIASEVVENPSSYCKRSISLWPPATPDELTPLLEYAIRLRDDLASNLQSDVPSADERKTFLHWVKNIEADQRINGEFIVNVAKRKAIMQSLRDCVENPDNLTLYPPELIKTFQSQLAAGVIFMKDDSEFIGFQGHQLLGAPTLVQHAARVNAQHVLLLELSSDDAMDFMFCDLGLIQFWIKHSDLDELNFDQAWATAEG